MEVRIETVAPMRVAFMRHVGPYDQVGPLWEKLFVFAMRARMFGPAFKMLGVPHDDPSVTPADKLRYDACIAVDEKFEPRDDIGVQDIRGGEYAVTKHRGPYEGLGDAYDALIGRWLPNSS